MSALCSACKDKYKDPRVLPCLHSYCKNCVEKLFTNKGENEGFVCPECHTDIEITTKDLPSLPANFAINNLMPLLTLHSRGSKNRLKCENCDSKKAAAGRCSDCCLFMCSFCITAHRRIHTLKDHDIMTLKAVKRAEPRTLAKRTLCSRHKEETMTLFCETCDKLICRDCTIFDHHGHEYVAISTIMNREKKVIATAMMATKEKIPNLEAVLLSTQKMKNRVEERIEYTNTKVDQFIEKQIRVLEQVRHELRRGVAAVGKTKLMLLGAQEKRLSIQLVNTKSAVDFTKQTTCNGSDPEILCLKNQMLSRLSHLSGNHVDAHPCQDDWLNLRVNHACTVRDFIHKLAVIDSSTAVPLYSELQVVGGEQEVFYTTFCGQSCEFIVTLRDHFLKQLRKGGNTVQAIIVDRPFAKKGTSPTSLELMLSDNQNGTYSFQYKPTSSGKYLLTVKVDGIHIKGSPFQWYVAQKIVNANPNTEYQAIISSRNGMYQNNCTALGDIVIEGGYCFSWKVKFRSKPGFDESENLGRLSPTHSTSLTPEFFENSKIGVYKSLQFPAAPDGSISVFSPLSSSKCHVDIKDAWFWCDGNVYTPSCTTNSVSRISSYKSGDVFVLFLNPKNKTLTIFNSSNGQRDVIEEVECPVSPYLTNFASIALDA